MTHFIPDPLLERLAKKLQAAISHTPLSVPVGFAAFPNELFKAMVRVVIWIIILFAIEAGRK